MDFDITLITPTGSRPEAFRLCEQWIARQTFKGTMQWIVVDDGVPPTRISQGQVYLRRQPAEAGRAPTLGMNLLAALDGVGSEKVLIIEDDDWYRDDYVAVMAGLLDRYALVGERTSRYFNVKYRKWRIFRNRRRTSLCQTGFRRSLLGLVKRACEDPGGDVVSTRLMWSEARNKLLFDELAPLCVGIKAMPGRRGIGVGHRALFFRSDPGMGKLREWIGEDYRSYESYAGSSLPASVVGPVPGSGSSPGSPL